MGRWRKVSGTAEGGHWEGSGKAVGGSRKGGHRTQYTDGSAAVESGHRVRRRNTKGYCSKMTGKGSQTQRKSQEKQWMATKTRGAAGRERQGKHKKQAGKDSENTHTQATAVRNWRNVINGSDPRYEMVTRVQWVYTRGSWHNLSARWMTRVRWIFTRGGRLDAVDQRDPGAHL